MPSELVPSLGATIAGVPSVGFIVVTLRIPAALPEKNRDHSLTGNTVANCYGIVNMVFDSFSAVDLPDSWERVAVGTHADLFGG